MAHRATIITEEYTYTVILEPDEEAGGFVVTCPALPGLVTEGDTIEEARAMAADAIKGYLESLRKHGHPIPPGETHESEPIRDKVTVKLERV
jgi:antitoxin HicB